MFFVCAAQLSSLFEHFAALSHVLHAHKKRLFLFFVVKILFHGVPACGLIHRDKQFFHQSSCCSVDPKLGQLWEVSTYITNRMPKWQIDWGKHRDPCARSKLLDPTQKDRLSDVFGGRQRGRVLGCFGAVGASLDQRGKVGLSSLD